MAALLSIDQVAEQLTMTPQSIRKWIKKGKLTAIKMPGKNGEWRFRQEYIDSWLNKRTVKAKHAL